MSDNFNPVYALSWIASEAEQALQRDVSTDAARAFERAPVSTLIRNWRDESSRGEPIWRSFSGLSQSSQEAIAAGFEYIGRKPAS